MSAHDCDDCGSRMRVFDTAHGGELTYRKLRCRCGSGFETVEKRSKRLPGLAISSQGQPALDSPGNGGLGVSDLNLLSGLETKSPLLGNQTRGRARGKNKAETPEFVAFYATYPIRVKRPRAWSAWLSNDCQSIVVSVMDGVQRWTDFWTRANTAPDKIPHPASFLNGHQYNDTPPAVVASAPKFEPIAVRLEREREDRRLAEQEDRIFGGGR